MHLSAVRCCLVSSALVVQLIGCGDKGQRADDGAYTTTVDAAVDANIDGGPDAAPAGAGAIAISELHYHPVTGQPEFIELVNRGTTTVDLSRWQVRGAVDHVITGAATLAPGQYVVLTNDVVAFARQWPDISALSYVGTLPNSNGQLGIYDSSGHLSDDVSYQDGRGTVGEWPVSADGDGNSLQRFAALDIDHGPHAWTAATPTPGIVNSVTDIPPRAEQTQWTTLPQPGQDIVVNAKLFGAVDAQLEVRIGFAGPSQLFVFAPTASGVSAVVPAARYQAGDLVRMRIIAQDQPIVPLPDDTIRWFGTTVAAPSGSSLPKLEWFVNDDELALLRGAPLSEDKYSCVLAYNGQIWDGSSYALRGNFSRRMPKQSFKLRFPKHHKAMIPGLPQPVDNVDLTSNAVDESKVRQVMAHGLAGTMGVVSIAALDAEVHKNGSFYALYVIQEHPDSDFRKRQSLNDTSFYDTGTDIGAYGIPPSAGYESENVLLAGPDGYLPSGISNDTWNIPAWINLMAASSVIGHADFRMGNFYMWVDHALGDRANGMLWDMDFTFGRVYGIDAAFTELESPGIWTSWRRWRLQIAQPDFMEPALVDPTYRQMYLRRVRTLTDQYIASGYIARRARELFTSVAPLWEADNAAWPQINGGTLSQQQAIDRLANDFPSGLLAHINAGGPIGDVPPSQSANPAVVVVGLLDQGTVGERIVLQNQETTAIDVSGFSLRCSQWSLQLPPGAGLPAGGIAVVALNDSLTGLRAQAPGLLVLATYTQTPIDPVSLQLLPALALP
jgi:hypothetical protein